MNTQKKIRALVLSVGCVILFIIILVLLAQVKNLIPQKFERYAHGIFGTIAAISSVWIFLRYEKKTFSDIGLIWQKRTLQKFIIGLAVGIVMGALMLYTQVLISGLQITLSDDYNISSFIIWSSALIPLAFMEEIAFRSYPFIKLNRIFGLRITQIIIAILFALYHILNGWSIGLSFLGPGIWALAYGLSAILSNGISMPTGFHYGVNLILAAISTKSGMNGIWTIDFPTKVSETALKTNENVGTAIQIGLLIICVIATELYLKNRKNTANNIYETKLK